MTFSAKLTALTLAASAIVLAAPASAKEFQPGADTDGNGELSTVEFVTFAYNRDLKRLDKNADQVLTSEEWTAGDSKWMNDLNKKFNKNKDGVLDNDELVAVYMSIFANRDKDKNDSVSLEEAPPWMTRD